MIGDAQAELSKFCTEHGFHFAEMFTKRNKEHHIAVMIEYGDEGNEIVVRRVWTDSEFNFREYENVLIDLKQIVAEGVDKYVARMRR